MGYEALFESFIMLMCQDGSRIENRHLFTGPQGSKGSANGLLRLSKAKIAAQEVVNWNVTVTEITQHLLHGDVLVVGEREWKAIEKQSIGVLMDWKRVSCDVVMRGIQIMQVDELTTNVVTRSVTRQVAHSTGPCFAVTLVEKLRSISS
ncbi:hypothetical protein BWQ96_06727 [Gracilariopsis chorda]|uniref:Uncharacterized protein n=1 Tax=Gracilariopsis chorda TaxID=448386 RepID=A0A2V3IN63_9FLOR|nr:hypothetical protein BWQ96_06727 [Gracilariopsis chorda]|eukprot:PXF43526.1 hypothetical protein BWQ96_06727 [Gracilariopsis chorda]